ncbi:hypothetical protein J6590_021682 [Homalodisca vitripennis]|nr:hypothetical protein J6590_021682 [Homalodisca vitripennis]
MEKNNSVSREDFNLSDDDDKQTVPTDNEEKVLTYDENLLMDSSQDLYLTKKQDRPDVLNTRSGVAKRTCDYTNRLSDLVSHM